MNALTFFFWSRKSILNKSKPGESPVCRIRPTGTDDDRATSEETKMSNKLKEIKIEDLKRIVPSVFATRRNPNMSERYIHVPTSEILAPMQDRGFVVTSAKQDTARQRDPNYVRHELRLTHIDNIGVPAKVGATVPQMIIENSGNGRTKLRGKAGMYRYWCANGCTMGSNFETFELIHMYQIRAQIDAMMDSITGQFERQLRCIDAFRVLKLSKQRQSAFALNALRLRFGKEGAKAYQPKDVLEARRKEDEGDDLWHVFNRVQENITRGGFAGESANGRTLGVRELTGISSARDLNAGLWDLAEKIAA